MSRASWSAFDPSGSPVLSMDFTKDVLAQGGGSIASATFSVSVLSGSDPSASAVIVGPVTISSGTIVSFQKAPGAGVSGAQYLVTVKAVMSGTLGQVLVKSAVLPIQTGGA